MKNVILCGGSGTRLWPLSRKLLPKQYLKLFDNESLFQQTIKRNEGLFESLMIITNLEQYFIALDQLEELESKFNSKNTKFLLEEIGKNTAAAIAFAALESDEDEILFITPSDHLIKNFSEYKKAIQKAKRLAQDGYLVTFGINPTEANTGYGYIESKGEDVICFHEKPDSLKAKEYLKKGNYYWNSGMFMFKAGVYLNELKKHSFDVYESVVYSYEHKQCLGDSHIRLKRMQNIPDISVDYALMEKSKKIKVVKGDFEWNDVGSFDSLINEMKSKKAIEIDSKNNFYFADENKTVAAVGIEDLIVIDTKDALLIAKKGTTQKVKEVVKRLKKENPELLKSHVIVHRPWGTFETLIDANGYKIKRIVVKPGKRLSLQKHYHRSEHWVVVSGTAEVQVGDEVFLIKSNESTYIKMGEIHRLSNPGKIPVVLIEAQVGEYTGEDDIVRIEDDFKRGC